MKRNHIAWSLASSLTVLTMAVLPTSALSTPKSLAASTNGTSSADKARIQRIITRGNAEIDRRLATLKSLAGKVSGTTKLTASDQASLVSEVSDETTGLTNLRAKLDADTTVADAQTDAQSIITGYRVYALVVPKIGLVKTADDQQVAEAKFLALVPKLQSRIDTAKAAGKNVSSLQSGVNDMTTNLNNAQAISASVESSVVILQPSDINADHTILSGYRDKLKTAQTDIRTAVSDAKSTVNALKNL